MKKLHKALEKHAKHHKINVQRMFEIFVDMQYMFVITGISNAKYNNYAQSVGELTTVYLNEIKRKQFRDTLGELMAHINVLKNGKRDKHCQHLTPTPLSDAVSQMMDVDTDAKDISYVCDIACGTGALALSKLKEFKQKRQSKDVALVLNDLDSFACKVVVIQIEFNNYLHINFPISYLVYNHDALLEYEHFALKGITKRTKIMGCDVPALITNQEIRKTFGSQEHIESALLIRSMFTIQAFNKKLTTPEIKSAA
ncbi:hypothetical protein MADA3029_740096 [Vibrio nigripulchritudo MADA3029]|uniref:hypothetical protein n=1 Tax=Vibrio nigripulchritudo TaxID=28173 RepID=UPI0003B2223A|nr:hypothetical protein [Vibrio nigripulchritudo]CCN49190.1 hypothetical protein VIBNIMADA3020_710029 [Vibrio nigripulchritudo MADA3020]CCN54175.1 hypothetical protein VIBNIMADA3021_510098 [Vibrio nigripulchritudo MADA3021]CCN61245.1 hypothetical protein MADA3029_740096 [Vibrio nigripulchritudo MADA3029]